jgi:hypothetical protein
MGPAKAPRAKIKTLKTKTLKTKTLKKNGIPISLMSTEE